MKQSELFIPVKSQHEIKALFTDARVVPMSFALMRVKTIAADSPWPLQVLFAVSRKTGTAVQRNTIRRRIRESLKAVVIGFREQGISPAEPQRSFRIAFLANRKALTEPLPNLQAELRRKLITLMEGTP